MWPILERILHLPNFVPKTSKFHMHTPYLCGRVLRALFGTFIRSQQKTVKMCREYVLPSLVVQWQQAKTKRNTHGRAYVRVMNAREDNGPLEWIKRNFILSHTNKESDGMTGDDDNSVRWLGSPPLQLWVKVGRWWWHCMQNRRIRALQLCVA